MLRLFIMKEIQMSELFLPTWQRSDRIWRSLGCGGKAFRCPFVERIR